MIRDTARCHLRWHSTANLHTSLLLSLVVVLQQNVYKRGCSLTQAKLHDSLCPYIQINYKFTKYIKMPTNALRCHSSKFIAQWPPTCFDLSCGHLQGGENMNTNINQMCLNHSTDYNHTVFGQNSRFSNSTTATSPKCQQLEIVVRSWWSDVRRGCMCWIVTEIAERWYSLYCKPWRRPHEWPKHVDSMQWN